MSDYLYNNSSSSNSGSSFYSLGCDSRGEVRSIKLNFNDGIISQQPSTSASPTIAKKKKIQEGRNYKY